MVGLLIKDVLQLKKLWLKLYAIIGVVIALSVGVVFLKGSSIIVVIFIGMILLNSIQTLFTNDQAGKWLDYVKTVNISKKVIVFSRYVTSFCVILFITLCSYLSLLAITVMYRSFTISQTFTFALIIFCVTTFYILFLIPFFYLFNQNGLSFGAIVLLLSIFGISRILSLNSIGNYLLGASHVIILEEVLALIACEAIISYFVSLMVLTLKSR